MGPNQVTGASDEDPPSDGLFDPLNQPYGATPIEEEDRQHLLPEHQGIETMAELNSLESENITRGLLWARLEGFETGDLLNQYTLRAIHRQMYGDVWDWAGQIRQRSMTIGIDASQIQEQWKAALDDAAYWIEAKVWSPGEIALRLHHRTVQIHPFVNGNGRHTRLMSDELLVSLGLSDDTLSWGTHLGDATTEELRQHYLRSLRALDLNRNDIQPLIEFALNPEADHSWP